MKRDIRLFAMLKENRRMQVLGTLFVGAAIVALSTCVTTSPRPAPRDQAPQASSRDDSDKPAETEGFYLAGASEVRLNGSATIGSWDAATHELGGTFKPGVKPAQVQTLIDRMKQAERDQGEPDRSALNLTPTHAPQISLEVPVTSLKSGKQAMEEDMHAALKAEAHPHIRYEFQQVEDMDWSLAEDNQTPLITLTTTGTLTLAGITEPIRMQVRVRPLGDGRYSILGRRQFDMATFNIEPPTALFGLIRADEQVEVVFDLIVHSGAEQPATRPADREGNR